MRTTAEVLRDAKSRIDAPEKWCKWVGRSGSRRCVITALYDAAGYPNASEREYGAARAIIFDLVRAAGYERVDLFNDAADTDHARVMRFFDDAIAIASASEAR